MDIPTDISTWNLQTVRALVNAVDYEPDWFDFKEVLTGQDPKIPDRIRALSCAMANSDGGFQIFGVIDQASRKPGEDPIVGLDLMSRPDLRKQFGDVVQHLKRGIRFDSSPKVIAVTPDGSRGVFVVHVPKSQLGPHQWDGRFWKRGSGGSCAQMEYSEVRDHMLLTEERLKKVSLLRLELKDTLLTSEAMTQGLKGNSNLAFDRYEPASLKALTADTCAVLPNDGMLQESLLAISRLARRHNEILVRLNDHFLKTWDPNLPFRWNQDAAGAQAEKVRHELYKGAEDDRKEIIKLCRSCEAILAKAFDVAPGK